MSREIKFRCWNKELEIYVFQACGGLCFQKGIAELWASTLIYEQYTGLKDKNGKEIYEGDIVRWFDDFEESAFISFDEGCFWVNWPINSERINREMVDDFEVIGNIHENPELIGGE